MNKYKQFFAQAIYFFPFLLLASCKQSDKSEAPDKTPVAVKILSLDVSNAAQSTSNNEISYSSTIGPSKSIGLSFQVGGTLLQIPIEMGQYVHKGQLIAEVDPTTYQNQYNAQLAQVKIAKENYDRILTVFNKGSIAEIKMLSAKADYEQALAASKATYQNIVHTKLYAPKSGYIGAKNIEAGATAGPGISVAEIVDIAQVYANVPIPEGEINAYKRGDAAKIVVPPLGNELFTGKIDKVSILASKGSPIYSVQVLIDNGAQKLKPGMSCNVFLNRNNSAIKQNNSSAQSSIILPTESVQIDDNGNNFIYIAEGNKAVKKDVSIAGLYEDGIGISSGVNTSDKVIISGFHKITDGTTITIIK